jgi:hypothetical protein
LQYESAKIKSTVFKYAHQLFLYPTNIKQKNIIKKI